MISERVLKKWRREALKTREMKIVTTVDPEYAEKMLFLPPSYLDLIDRVLRLTQELSDLILIKKG